MTRSESTRLAGSRSRARRRVERALDGAAAAARSMRRSSPPRIARRVRGRRRSATTTGPRTRAARRARGGGSPRPRRSARSPSACCSWHRRWKPINRRTSRPTFRRSEAERAPADASRDAASLARGRATSPGAGTLPRAEARRTQRAKTIAVRHSRARLIQRRNRRRGRTRKRPRSRNRREPMRPRTSASRPSSRRVPAARALAEAPVAAAPPPAPPDDGKTAPRAFPRAAPAPSIAAAPAPPSAPAAPSPAELAKSETAANAGDVRRRESGERVAAMAPPPPAAEPARRAQADRAAQGAAAAPMREAAGPHASGVDRADPHAACRATLRRGGARVERVPRRVSRCGHAAACSRFRRGRRASSEARI